MDPITLTNVFESHKEALSEKLKGLSLPHDARKVQEIVADFLNSLFESDGIYRQNLNQSEDTFFNQPCNFFKHNRIYQQK